MLSSYKRQDALSSKGSRKAAGKAKMATEQEGTDALGNTEREQHMDAAVECALIVDLLKRVEAGEFLPTARFVFFRDKYPFKEKKKIKIVPLQNITREYLRNLLNGIVPDAWVRLSPAGSGEVIEDAVGNLTVNLTARPRLQHILPPGLRIRRNKARKRNRKPWMKKKDNEDE